MGFNTLVKYYIKHKRFFIKCYKYKASPAPRDRRTFETGLSLVYSLALYRICLSGIPLVSAALVHARTTLAPTNQDSDDVI